MLYHLSAYVQVLAETYRCVQALEPQSPEERRVGQLEDQDIIHYDTHTHTPYTHTHTQYTTTVPVLESVERGRLRVTFG